MLAASLLVVHDTECGRQHDVSELSKKAVIRLGGEGTRYLITGGGGVMLNTAGLVM